MKIDISGIEFPLTLDLQNAKLFGTIPASLVTPMLLKEIDKYDNYSLRDTEFDRWRTNDINLGLINQGVGVQCSVSLKHRTFLFSFRGEKHYTNWVSVTLNGRAEFSVSISNNTVHVDYLSHNIKGQGWYEGIVSLLANDLFKSKVANVLRDSLQQFNGQNIASFLKPGTITENELRIPISLDELLKNVSASATINPNGIAIDIKLPAQVVIT